MFPDQEFYNADVCEYIHYLQLPKIVDKSFKIILIIGTGNNWKQLINLAQKDLNINANKASRGFCMHLSF